MDVGRRGAPWLMGNGCGAEHATHSQEASIASGCPFREQLSASRGTLRLSLLQARLITGQLRRVCGVRFRCERASRARPVARAIG